MSSGSRTHSQGRSKTHAGLPAPKKLLQIDWQPRTLAVTDKDETQLVKNPKTTLLKFLPGAKTSWTDNKKVNLAQFFAEFQAQLKAYVDDSLAESSHTVQMIADQQSVANKMVANAIEHLTHNSVAMQQVIQELLVEREANKVAATEPLDIEMPDAPELPDYNYYIQEAISKGWIKIIAPEPASGRPRAARLFTQEQFPLPLAHSPPPESPIVPFERQQQSYPPGPSYTPLPPAAQRSFTGGLF